MKIILDGFCFGDLQIVSVPLRGYLFEIGNYDKPSQKHEVCFRPLTGMFV